MANKKITFQITLDVKNGVIQTQNLTKEVGRLKERIESANAQSEKFANNLGQTASKAGLAGAAVVEIGRTISDANYGMTAMANNLQQVSTLFVTLVSTSGGLTNGLKLLGAAFRGPLGIIVLFQIGFALMERFALAQKEGARAAKNYANELDKQGEAVERLLKNNAYKEVIAQNDPEKLLIVERQRKKIVLAELQRLKVLLEQKKVLREQLELGEQMGFWGAVEEEVKNANYNYLVGLGAALYKGMSDFFKPYASMGGLIKAATKVDPSARSKDSDAIQAVDAEIQAIEDRILEWQAKLVGGGKDGKKPPKEKWLEAFGMGATYDEITTGSIEILKTYQMHKEAELEITRRMNELQGQAAMELAEAERIAAEHRISTMRNIGNALIDLGFVVGKQTAAGKGIAVAGALIDTYAAATAILKNAGKTQAGGIPGYAIAQAAAAITFGLAQVRQILSVKVPNSGGAGSGSAGTGAGATVTPQFNIIGSSGPNRIGEAVRDAMGERPVKAYVTTKDINSAQELDRNTKGGATL